MNRIFGQQVVDPSPVPFFHKDDHGAFESHTRKSLNPSYCKKAAIITLMSCAFTKWLDAKREQTRYSFDDFYIDFKAATLDYARWALWQNLVPGRLASLCARHAVLPAQRTTNERFSIVLAGIMARSTMQLECLAYLIMYHRKQNWTSSTVREFGVFVRLVVLAIVVAVLVVEVVVVAMAAVAVFVILRLQQLLLAFSWIQGLLAVALVVAVPTVLKATCRQ